MAASYYALARFVSVAKLSFVLWYRVLSVFSFVQLCYCMLSQTHISLCLRRQGYSAIAGYPTSDPTLYSTRLCRLARKSAIAGYYAICRRDCNMSWTSLVSLLFGAIAE